jgi:HAD superfamily hydrolase (TIGR01490 family)
VGTGAPRAAAFFDLDKTVIAKSSALAFSRPFYRGGLINRRAVLRSAYAQFVYLAGGADADQIERMRRYLSSLCAGWDVATVREIIAETLHDLIDPFIYEEAAELIEEHRLAGRDVVIVSTSGSEVVEPIGEMLGADRVIATRMAVDPDGRYTGEIDFYAYGEAKAEAMRELAVTDNIDLARSYAYSDSSTDIPMLAAVGNGYVVNPDRGLRKEALARGWPVLSFNRPVSMRRRMPTISRPSTPVLAATAVAAAVVGAATVYWFSSRRASA